MGPLLREKLEGAKPAFKAVAMPDFYLDYLLRYPGNLDEMTASLAAVAQRGGGNLLGWKHVVGRGGNSSNLAAQLAKLHVEVVPIVETSGLGRAVLEQSLPGADLSHVKTTGIMSSSLCLEVGYSGRRVNIMMSNPASHTNFGPEKLTQEDRGLIRGSDFVAVLNWGQNKRGTDLAEEVFKTARQGKAVTFFDPGDPTARQQDLGELLNRLIVKGLVDVLSLNEYELLQLSDTFRRRGEGSIESGLFESAGALSMFGCRIDLHTPEFSATFTEGRADKVRCLAIKPAKVTGAGDVWNAASIFAQGMRLEATDRLLFANAAAATYLAREDLDPPGLEEILASAEKLETLVRSSRG